MKISGCIAVILFFQLKIYAQTNTIRLPFESARSMSITGLYEHTSATRFIEGGDYRLNGNRLNTGFNFGVTNFLNISAGADFKQNSHNNPLQPQDARVSLKFKWSYRLSNVLGPKDIFDLHIFPQIDFLTPMQKYDTWSVFSIGNGNQGVQLGTSIYLDIKRLNAMVSAYVGYGKFNNYLPRTLTFNLSTGWLVKSIYLEAIYNYKKAYAEEPDFDSGFEGAAHYPIQYTVLGANIGYQKFKNWNFKMGASYVIKGHLVWNNLALQVGITRYFNFKKQE